MPMLSIQVLLHDRKSGETIIDVLTFLYGLIYVNEFILKNLYWLGLKLAVTRVNIKIDVFSPS